MKGQAEGRLEQTKSINEITRTLFNTLYNRLAGAYEPILVKVLGYSGHEVVSQTLAPYLDGLDGPVLDAGCGTGLTARSLLALRPGIAVDGFDIAGDMVDIARKRGLYRNLMVADATKPLPVEAGTYAAAISSGLYTEGHVGAEALGPTLDALRPGGLFGFYVYEPIYVKLGFKAEIERLVANGDISILEETSAKHFSRLAGQACRIFVARKA